MNKKLSKLRAILFGIVLVIAFIGLFIVTFLVFRINDERISPEQLGNNFQAISNFGMKEFKCTGSCYCEEDYFDDVNSSSKRRSTISITRGVKYLATALSAIVATNLAKSYFDKECTTILEDSCSDKTAIRSEVGECEALVDGEEVECEVLQEEEDSKIVEHHFTCEGRCAFGGVTESEVKAVGVWNFWTFDLKQKKKWFGLVKEYLPAPKGRGKCNNLHLRGQDVVSTDTNRAKKYFAVNVMDPYCRKYSRWHFKRSKWNIFKKKEDKVYHKNFCVGYLVDGDVTLVPNTVSCK